MALTDERKLELEADYVKIKDDIFDIEYKYSPEFHVIKIDFPPTLGMEPLTYERHTEQQLREIAETQLASKYSEKSRRLEKSYNMQLRKLQYARETLLAKHQKILADILDKYQTDVAALMHRLVNNGLLYSDIKAGALAALSAETQEQNAKQTAYYSERDAAYSQRIERLCQAVEQERATLETAHAEEIAALAQTLAAKEEKLFFSIEKYNSSLEEKETKYQASCTRQTYYAQQAENERALAVLRLYGLMGQSGVDQRMQTEILSYCRSAFARYTQEEARYILSIDSFLQVHMDVYYSGLVDWVNIELRP